MSAVRVRGQRTLVTLVAQVVHLLASFSVVMVVSVVGVTVGHVKQPLSLVEECTVDVVGCATVTTRPTVKAPFNRPVQPPTTGSGSLGKSEPG